MCLHGIYYGRFQKRVKPFGELLFARNKLSNAGDQPNLWRKPDKQEILEIIQNQHKAENKRYAHPKENRERQRTIVQSILRQPSKKDGRNNDTQNGNHHKGRQPCTTKCDILQGDFWNLFGNKARSLAGCIGHCRKDCIGTIQEFLLHRRKSFGFVRHDVDYMEFDRIVKKNFGVEPVGFEPTTSCLQSTRSPI